MPTTPATEMELQAVRRQGPIEIDGRLDEPEWERAPVATNFIQQEPDEGQPALDQTEVRILYDDEALYVGARMYDRDPASIGRQLTRRDEGGRAYGYVQISLDPNLDRTTGYTFRLTAAGVQVDRFHYDDTNQDSSWQSVWEAQVAVDEEGWTAELRIPLSQLRYDPAAEPQSWGLQIGRRNISTNERSDWAFTPRGIHGGVSRWGQLVGLELPHRPSSLEVVPYVMGGIERADAVPGDPFFDGSQARSNVGVDLRYGIGSTFMLDMAVNPDFGQVELDPRVINLTAFETFLPEQRPFFTRDDRDFDFSLSGPQNNLFYSRRIGGAPRVGPPSGSQFSEVPGETTILGAAKVTGRTRSGLTVGVLGALTGEEQGRALLGEGSEIQRFVAEPQTRYLTARLRQDLREGQSRIGTLVTTVDRTLPGDGALDHLLSEAFTGGVDFEHTWADREWALWGFLAGSHVRGSQEALTRLQQAPNHYFQRPDQDYLELDPERTHLSGAEWRLQFERRSGRHWTGAIWAAQRTPGFEVNDLGFSTASERLDAGARIQYQELTPGDLFRSYSFTLSTFHNWRHSVTDDFFSASAWGEAHKAGRVNLNSNFTFLNYWGLGIQTSYGPEVLSDGLTRGGPLMVSPATRQVQISANTDARDTYVFRTSVSYEDGRRGGYETSASAGVEARPANGLLLSLDPTWTRARDVRQYVRTIADPDFEPTYGARYIFGDLRREQFSLDTRVNLILSPTLSLQLFAQPLVAAGDYQSYRALAQASSFDFQHFADGDAETGAGADQCQAPGAEPALCRTEDQVLVDLSGDGEVDARFPEQNFNVRSLRANAVLRWEFRPASRLHLVWQQRRSGPAGTGVFDFADDMRALANAPSENVFMIKVDYWLDL